MSLSSSRVLTIASLFFTCHAGLVEAQNFRFSIIAGTGTYSGDGGPAAAALIGPAAVAFGTGGYIYVSDPANFRIRKIDGFGTITTLIGLGYETYSGDGGPASAAGMSGAYSMATDASGNLYFGDGANNRIREVTTAGIVRTVAGSGTCGTLTAGIQAGTAPLCDVESVATDSQGRVYFATESQIWMIGTNGALVLIAGTGEFGIKGDGGPATAAAIGYPGSMVIDAAGTIYLGDQYNFVVRKITPDELIATAIQLSLSTSTTVQVALDSSGTPYYVTGRNQVFRLNQGVGTVVGTVTSPDDASCLAISSTGAMYVCSTNTLRLLKISGGATSIVSGDYPYGVEQALPMPAKNAHLHLNPLLISLAVDATGNVYFSELDGNLVNPIEKISPDGTLTRPTAVSKLPTGGDFTSEAIAISPSGQLYFSTFTQVYRLEANGSVTLIAGAAGFPANLGDGGAAISARLSNPSSLAFDQSGNLYITEPFDSRVRKVNAQGIITTFAGSSIGGGYSGDGGPSNAALLSTPVDVKVDSAGNVYIADLTASVVRKVNTSGVISTVAGNGTKGVSGDNDLATKAQLSGAAAIAIDPSGNLFIADRPSAASTISPATDNNRIRMVNAAGIITTIAGGVRGYDHEGIVSSLAAVGGPVALAADSQGNIYVNEAGSQRIRKLTPAPAVVIDSVYTSGGFPDIAQNAFIEIRGANLAPANLPFSSAIWSSAPEFASGKMPTQLSNVSVTINGKPAFIYYVSPSQINALTPLDSTLGNVSIVVTNNAVSSAPFSVKMGAAAPSFLRFGATSYVVATHADASLLGPAWMSVPGAAFTPARPGETIVMYAVGFGLPVSTLVNGASTQYGVLPVSPDVRINGTTASLPFTGVNGSPGLYQFNVVVPANAPDGDLPIQANYGNASSLQSGLAVQH